MPIETTGDEHGEIVTKCGTRAHCGDFSPPLLLVPPRSSVTGGGPAFFCLSSFQGLICAGPALRISFRNHGPKFPSSVGQHRCWAVRAQGGWGLRRQMLGIRNIWPLLGAINPLRHAVTHRLGISATCSNIRDRHLLPDQNERAHESLGSRQHLCFGLAIPALADRIGRKPTAIIASLMGVICPLAALYYPGSVANSWFPHVPWLGARRSFQFCSWPRCRQRAYRSVPLRQRSG